MKIVVRVPNWIGDVIFALPVLESLKTDFPGAEIWLAAQNSVKDIFSGGEFAERVIPLPGSRTLRGLRAEARDLRRQAFDLGILLTNSLGSALVFRLAGIPDRWGYRSDGRGLLLTRSVPRKNTDPPAHMVRYYLGLLEGLGLRTNRPEISLTVSEEEKARAGRELAGRGADAGRPLVILNPGAAHGPAKRWPVSRFAETARLLQERTGADIAITGAAGDAGLAAAVAAPLGRKPIDFTGATTLRGLLGIMSRAAVILTNDTGPMHLANALRVPVVAVFGPTDPRVTAPFFSPATVLKKDGVPCWPCEYRECPYDHRCMTGISAEEAASALKEYLP
jgi:heptosyltransferase-2